MNVGNLWPRLNKGDEVLTNYPDATKAPEVRLKVIEIHPTARSSSGASIVVDFVEEVKMISLDPFWLYWEKEAQS